MSNSNFIQLKPSTDVFHKKKKMTVKKQSFYVEDETGSIEVVVWGDKTQQCRNLSVGDDIILTNVKFNQREKNLQSTSSTDIIQVGPHCSLDPKVQLC